MRHVRLKIAIPVAILLLLTGFLSFTEALAANPVASMTLNKQVGSGSGWTVTLTTIEVLDNKQFRINLAYHKDDPAAGALTCPPQNPDEAYLTLLDGSRVNPVDQFCNTRRGQSFNSDFASWGIFPEVRAEQQPFTLVWYGWPSVADITYKEFGRCTRDQNGAYHCVWCKASICNPVQTPPDLLSNRPPVPGVGGIAKEICAAGGVPIPDVCSLAGQFTDYPGGPPPQTITILPQSEVPFVGGGQRNPLPHDRR